MKKIRAGVIGLGVGEQHVRSYQSIDDCEVAVVVDLDIDRARDVAERYGIAAASDDFRHVTEDPTIDLVSICSFDNFHAEHTISAFRHGKHVMVEKPAVLRPSEAEAVLRAQSDAGTLMTSNLILRKSPRFVELKERIQSGGLGEIFYMEGDYIHDILWKITEGWRGKMDFHCTFYGGGVHLVDLMRWLIEDEIVEVVAMGNDILTRDSSYEFVDTIVALMRFRGEALAKCATTFGPKRTKFHALNVYGTKATFVNDMPKAKFFIGDDPSDETTIDTPYPGMEKGDMLPEFVEAVRAGRPASVSEVDIFRVMAVCFAVWDSVEQRRIVSVPSLI